MLQIYLLTCFISLYNIHNFSCFLPFFSRYSWRKIHPYIASEQKSSHSESSSNCNSSDSDSHSSDSDSSSSVSDSSSSGGGSSSSNGYSSSPDCDSSSSGGGSSSSNGYSSSTDCDSSSPDFNSSTPRKDSPQQNNDRLATPQKISRDNDAYHEQENIGSNDSVKDEDYVPDGNEAHESDRNISDTGSTSSNRRGKCPDKWKRRIAKAKRNSGKNVMWWKERTKKLNQRERLNHREVTNADFDIQTSLMKRKCPRFLNSTRD